MLLVITLVEEGSLVREPITFCENCTYISVYLWYSLVIGESGNVPIPELAPGSGLFLMLQFLSVLAVSVSREFSIVNSSKLVLSSKVLK